MSDGETSISTPAGPFCKAVVARRMVESRARRAEGDFEVSFGDDGRWRYASTLPESAVRRDVLLLQEGAGWALRVNAYGGEGPQLLCDDAEWPGGMLVGSTEGMSYEEAVGVAIRWLSDGWVDVEAKQGEEIG
ncbi:hypothetical protein [Rhizobium leguminosarum]|uniref:hypothetical protein n=1 Tax=Rhizobium leguminosarum TaxID=384 RepID=UPI002E0F323F|nr:hypothetical protein U8Q02_42200 [Rhizobium leguminosarum]